MKAEVAKLRYLPTPRWAVASAIAVSVGAGVLLYVLSPKNPDVYVTTGGIVTQFGGMIPAVVIGVWLVAVEFSSGTLQRTLTAQASRGRVLTDKLIAVVVIALVLGMAAAATVGGLASFAAGNAKVAVTDGDIARAVFSGVPVCVAAVFVGFGCALLTRSMGGGMSLAFAFLFVLDGLFGFVPTIKNLTYGTFTSDLTNHLAGTGETRHNVGVAILGIVVWLLIIVVPGWVAFVRGDLK